MYVNKNCVEQCLEALAFMLMMRLAYTKFAREQVREQLYNTRVFKSKIN